MQPDSKHVAAEEAGMHKEELAIEVISKFHETMRTAVLFGKAFQALPEDRQSLAVGVEERVFHCGFDVEEWAQHSATGCQGR